MHEQHAQRKGAEAARLGRLLAFPPKAVKAVGRTLSVGGGREDRTLVLIANGDRASGSSGIGLGRLRGRCSWG